MLNKINKKHLLIWIFVFVLLFVFNALTEAVLLPWWGLDNTPKNDLYFKIWWGVVAVWLLFGWPILNALGKRSRKKSRKDEPVTNKATDQFPDQ